MQKAKYSKVSIRRLLRLMWEWSFIRTRITETCFQMVMLEPEFPKVRMKFLVETLLMLSAKAVSEQEVINERCFRTFLLLDCLFQ